MDNNNNGKITPTGYVISKIQNEVLVYQKMEAILESLLNAKIKLHKLEFSFTEKNGSEQTGCFKNVQLAPEIGRAFDQFLADALYSVGIAIQDRKNKIEFLQHENERGK